MRVRHRVLLIGLLIGLLFPCLTFIEYPEFYSFHNDPSNAFVLANVPAQPSVALCRNTTSADTTVRTAVPAICPETSATLESSLNGEAQDLLALYSLRRT